MPAANAERFIALVEQRGHDATAMLAQSGLSRAQLADPTGRITIEDFGNVVWRCVELTDDPALGIEVGLALKPSGHGLLGLALMTCNSLRDAIAIGERFGELRASPWRLHLLVEGSTAIMRFVEVASMGRARS